jgi:hypothetical protein
MKIMKRRVGVWIVGFAVAMFPVLLSCNARDTSSPTAPDRSAASDDGGSATANRPKERCAPGGSRVEGGDPVTEFTAPAGQVVTGVCVKAGTGLSTFILDGAGICYSVSGIGTGSVTVTRIGEGPVCKGISHVDFYLTPQPVPTPTPTPIPTPTPTPTPTPIATPTP